MDNSNNPNPPSNRLTVEEYEVRIWGFVVIMVTLILVGVVSMLLYSVTFVTQPIKSMAPIDQAYTKMLNDIVLLIVGGIGGVMSKRAVGAMAKGFAGPQPPMHQPMCQPMHYQPNYGQSQYSARSAMPDFNWMGFQNPDLDESWTPGPPPTTPPDYVPPEASEIAQERAATRSET